MQNLRIVSVQVNNSSNIDVSFTEKLTSNLITSNISIISEVNNIPNSEVLVIKIIGNTINITCQPLTPFAAYIIQFTSTPLYPFISLNGNAKISEDGVSNKFLISGPLAPDNVVKNYFLSYFKDNIYNLDDDNAVVTKYVNSLSIILSKVLHDINQVKNENYLSFDIIDEQKIRGEGPFDRLNEEGAYSLIRIGRGPTSANASQTFPIDVFPSFPITLQKQTNIESLKVSSIDSVGYFNINNLVLNLNASPVTKVTSIVFTLTTSNPIYTYDISKLGYQIKNSRYDQNYAFDYAILNDNQIKISDKILDDPNFSLNEIFNIDVQYESKDLGRVVDETSVTVTTIFSAIRETLPPIINIFNLKHAPIVSANGNSIITNGVIFTDPNNNSPNAVHPAFVTELPFRLNGLPFSPGQYSVDYPTGTVYVYGSDLTNDGTGPYPPLVTYNYLFTYKSEQDYIYDPTLLDLVSLPHGNLTNAQGNINFKYEEVLIPEIDYKINLHQESLVERVDNRLLAINAIKTQNAPITNVFRIYNETSGEIYTIDRWSDNKIYFRYNNPPALDQAIGERASFNYINNELLFVNSTLTNASSINIFKIFLNNNSIVSSTEDGLGFAFNTSVVMSDNNVFIKEKWFNRQLSETININKLINIGEYLVDYINGVVYCAVSGSQNLSIGTVSYKNNNIVPQHPHLISVDDIYYQLSILNPKNKKFTYLSFDDGVIVPELLENTDELSLNNDNDTVYQIHNNEIGIFISSIFVPGVTNQIKFIRSLFEYDDLSNSTAPLNFYNVSSFNGFNIDVSPISDQIFENVQFDGTDYYVNINKNISYLSSNISYIFTVTRVSDSVVLWDNTGTIVPGDPLKLVLPGFGSPTVGDLVTVTYTFTINDLSRIVVDYNKGDYFVDYTYIADEIIVSYEYGDNVIDYRQNKNLPAGTLYYTSYKAGALRDALLRNFGTLVNIPELANFDIDFDRERYRDALTAALTSFIQGPTVSAIKNIGKTISHIEPEVIESVFENWSLGNSLLVPESITTTGTFELLPGKYDNGVLINSSNQTINFPINSNIRFEEGTFETWINPLWNGLDNDASLTFNILQDGYIIDSSKIFIGTSEYHPVINNGTFDLTKLSDAKGIPNKNKDGVFIYYDKDISGSFQRWYIEIIDGYVSPSSSSYKIKINSNGFFYDVKSLTIPKPSNLSMFTGNNSISLNISSGGSIDEGVTFLSDVDHYILDMGEEKSTNRMSIFKDISGYINFRVYDKNKITYNISADVSGWKNGDLHHIAASWKLNTRNNRDEMHLFIDGLEVPNIIKSGQKLRPYLHEKFRTVNPEEVLGASDRDIISSIDLHTTAGSATVSSSINFSAYNIFAGDIIFIDEVGFSSSGYTISTVNGQNLILSSNMPQTLTNGRFSINRTGFIVISEIDFSSNITVSTIHALISGTDISGSVGTNIVTSSLINFSTANVEPGYLIRIDDGALRTTYTILQVLGNSLMIDDQLPVNIINTSFRVYARIENEIPGVRALSPSYSISKDSNFNNILTVSNNVIAGDLILIRTLGLNYKRIKQDYYVWSDNVENILMTNLPPPISLDEANIIKIILPTIAVGPNNSTLSGGIFTSNNFLTDQPSESQHGRTLSVTLGGTNIDFSVPVQVTINGLSGINIISETVIFNDYGKLLFTNMYSSVNYINVIVKPISVTRAAGIITVKENSSITRAENSGYAPVVKFSYPIGYGYNLYQSSANTVTDDNKLFSGLDINNYLVISSPISVAGFYKITGLSVDRKTLTIEPTSAGTALPLPAFSNGVYQILNVNSYRGGLQNGFFTFEVSILPSQAYFLNKGSYEFEYYTYTKINLSPTNVKSFIGSDFHGNYQLNGLMDQVKIYSTMLTDTRIGESIPENQRSITKDFNSLKALQKDANTLMLMDFNTVPFVNSADFYTTPNSIKKHFHSSIVVNENFGNSLVMLNDPLIVSNDGILDTKKEATIEFWLSPLFDTANDPHTRFYFDAYGAVTEEVVSTNNTAVKISAPADRILSVKLKNDSKNIDYFAGGKLEIDTQNATSEEVVSSTSSSLIVSKSILQVISVKIIGDFTNTDYFDNGTIGTDNKTIYLGKILPSNTLSLSVIYQTTENNNNTINSQIIRLNKKLPYQKSHVVVNYIPKGLHGDRISIFKDEVGYINFAIAASGMDYIVRAPTYWAANTWHRIKASYKVNSGSNTDEMRLFIDGYQYNNVMFGSNLIFGNMPIISGMVTVGDGYSVLGNVKFKDSINELFIGSQYDNKFSAFSLIDNLRISNISRSIYAPYGEPLDVNYSSNIDMVFPVTQDLFTTYLLDYDNVSVINNDFTILKNRETGLFDFSVNIIDSLGIVSSSIKVQEALEKLIKVLKPANSRVFIQYIK